MDDSEFDSSFRLRVNTADLDAWRREADRHRTNLSALVRQVMAAYIDYCAAADRGVRSPKFNLRRPAVAGDPNPPPEVAASATAAAAPAAPPDPMERLAEMLKAMQARQGGASGEGTEP